MALLLADQMRAVEFLLVPQVLHDYKRHRNHHEGAEEEHRHRNRKVGLDEECIDAEHHKNGKVFVEVLHGNRAAGAHEYVASVLQERIHGNHEIARADADGNHACGGNEGRPGEREAEKGKAAGRRPVAREEGHEGDENAHADPHREHLEGAFERDARSGEHSAHGNAETHDRLHDGAFGKVHAERVFAPFENQKLQYGAGAPEKRCDGKRNLPEAVVPEERAASEEPLDRIVRIKLLLGVARARIRNGKVDERRGNVDEGDRKNGAFRKARKADRIEVEDGKNRLGRPARRRE